MTAVIKKSPWFIIEGVVLIGLGLAALLSPLVAGLTISVVIGAILLVSGGLGLVSTFANRGPMHHGLSIVSSVIALAFGLVLLFYPLAGPVGLAILLGVYLFVDGVVLIGLALDHRKQAAGRWGWLLASGVADLILGIVLLLLSAVGSAIALGLFIGIDLIVAGAALLFLYRATVIGPSASGNPSNEAA